MTDIYITKGTRVQVSFFKSKPLGEFSLAGVQLKTAASLIEGSGTVLNIWSNDPQGLVNLRFNVQMDDGEIHEVPKAGIKTVLPSHS